MKADRTAPYDAWLHWYLSERCTLNCDFCSYVPPSGLPKPVAPVTVIDIPALLRTLERAGRVFKISFTGAGEPFLVPNIVEACRRLTERHYVEFVTNLTPPAVERFACTIDPARVTVIHASLHSAALEQRGLLETYIRHFLLLKENGFALRCAELAHPALLRGVPALRSRLGARGIELSFFPFFGSYRGKRYPNAFSDGELAVFGLGPDDLRIFSPDGRLYNAGYNVAVVRENGEIRPCDALGERLGNIYSGIRFRRGLLRCPFGRCVCPLDVYDPRLFAAAKEAHSSAPLGALRAWAAGRGAAMRDLLPHAVKRGARRVVPEPVLAFRRRWRARRRAGGAGA